ncbi:hypothetical protein [Melghirimyces algeriensis]|nr:hypothetical protein [Melghirimyces algeriensis]
MKRAMYFAHNISYAEYSSNLDSMVEVEKKREKEYKRAKKLIV